MKMVDSSGEVVMAVRKAPKQKKTSKPSSSGRNMVPLYVLIIMILATAVVVMMNRSQDAKKTQDKIVTADDAGKSESKSGTQQPVTVDDSGTSKQDVKTGDKATDVKDKVADDTGKDNTTGIAKKVKIYFLVYNDRTGKIKPGAVTREIKGQNDILQALNSLAKGMTPAEEKRGLINAMPESMTFRSVVIRNNIAEIDCSQSFMENAQGDFLTGRLNQIFLTATQFPGVAGITVKINGKPVKSLGGDGLMIVWPMRKTL